jgi:hypothetical protein
MDPGVMTPEENQTLETEEIRNIETPNTFKMMKNDSFSEIYKE